VAKKKAAAPKKPMTKTEILAALAEDTGLSKKEVAEHRSTLDLTQECLGGMWGMLESLSIAPSQIEILDADDDGKMGLVNSVKVMAYRALTDKLSLLNDLCEIEDDNAGDGEEDLAHAARNTYCEAVQKITGYDPRDGNFHKENGPGE
jgi:hypothetical protein